MKINILKSSIKRNPNAGRTQYNYPGPKSVTGTFIGKEIPKKYTDKIIVLSMTAPLRHNVLPTFEFQLIGNKIPKWIFNDKRIKEINIEQQTYPIYSGTPEPEYFFKYENKHIKCSECGKKTPFKKIEEDWINDEYHVYICPHCNSSEGYPDFQFQSITEALNERGQVLK